MILTIRTDKPESELGLFDGSTKLTYETWQAHRQLAETIHQKIAKLLSVKGQTFEEGLESISGIVVYEGPGSFTGLRIGMSVANALAYSVDVPIAASSGDDWIETGIKNLQGHPTKTPITPEYGMAPNITKPRK